MSKEAYRELHSYSNSCAICGKTQKKDGSLLDRCTRCKVIVYCSKVSLNKEQSPPKKSAGFCSFKLCWRMKRKHSFHINISAYNSYLALIALTAHRSISESIGRNTRRHAKSFVSFEKAKTTRRWLMRS